MGSQMTEAVVVIGAFLISSALSPFVLNAIITVFADHDPVSLQWSANTCKREGEENAE